MLFATAGQSRIFLVMMYAGLAVGLYSSVDAAARRLFGAGRWMALFMDLIFGAAAACIVVCGLLLAADGELRLYSLMGAVCGYLIYAGTLARPVGALLTLTARCLKRLGAWLSARKLVKKLLK